MKVPHKLRYAFMKEMDKSSGVPIRHYNLLQRTEKVKAEKVLNIYEEQDEEVPMAHAEEYLKHHAGFKGIKVSGVGHNYVMKNKIVIDEIVKFLE